MKIGILGWGSLLWEGGPEFEQWHDPWQFDGPTLKLEFSRVSKTRLDALTLVIDEDHGTATRVAWCVSRRTNLEDAACDLRCREDTTLENIGRTLVHQAAESMASEEASDPIAAWARSKKLEAVVWTALKSNFAEKAKQPFTLDAALSYLRTLKPEGKAKAAEYVWRARRFVNTPLRSALETEPWFAQAGSEPNP